MVYTFFLLRAEAAGAAAARGGAEVRGNISRS